MDKLAVNERKSWLVDSNLLLLLFLGVFDPSRISKFKRTQRFSARDFEILAKFLVPFEVLTTPHILTEVSNLGTKLGADFRKIVFAKMLEKLKEVNVPGVEIVKSKLFVPLGFTDAAIEQVSSPMIAVLTDDSALAAALVRKGIQALSFDQVRAMLSQQ